MFLSITKKHTKTVYFKLFIYICTLGKTKDENS